MTSNIETMKWGELDDVELLLIARRKELESESRREELSKQAHYFLDSLMKKSESEEFSIVVSADHFGMTGNRNPDFEAMLKAFVLPLSKFCKDYGFKIIKAENDEIIKYDDEKPDDFVSNELGWYWKLTFSKK